MRFAIGLVLCFVSAVESRGAFECLPGPAPGSVSSWAWSLRDGGGTPTRAGLSIGRPAAVDGLVWTHGWGGWRRKRIGVAAELYGFAFEDLYREGLAGVWISTRGVHFGLRRWQVTWGDGLQRSGWTASADVQVRRGGTTARVVAQDLPFGRADRAGPRPTTAAGLGRRISSTLDAAASFRRNRLGSGIVWRLRWSPVSIVALTEEFLTPGTFTSGVELRASRLRVGISYAPLAGIGPRTEVSLSWNA